MRMLIFLILLMLLIILSGGCKLPNYKVDGLYINHTLVKANATVEDFCKAQGSSVEYIIHNKVRLSK